MSNFEVQVFLAPDDRLTALERDVRLGLTASPKFLQPIWFYDAVGSELFDEITRLPEYYPTRAETSILASHASEIIEKAGASVLVELGSGSSEKTRFLLDAMADASRLTHFIPFDVSESALTQAAKEISVAYDVLVTAIVGDYIHHLPKIPREGKRLVAFLGSTIGNFDPVERHRFLIDLEATMSYDDRLLLGTDLEKDARRLVAAYDDSAGVTAKFNLNILSVLNKELAGDFVLDRFEHIARWNHDERRIEMRLRSRQDQTVTFDKLGLSIMFATDEELLTEISSKFTAERVRTELAASNLVVESSWTDPAGDFLLTLAHPYC